MFHGIKIKQDPPLRPYVLVTLGLNDHEVTKNSSGVLLKVPIGDFENPFNALNEKILGWEILVQSQSEHFITVQKQVPKTGSNMHEIKK